MKQIVRNMKRHYKCERYDWMGYRITQSNKLTYHHYIKQVYGDYSDVIPNYLWWNGVLLTDQAHRYLHILEHKDVRRYILLQEKFRELNDSMQPPTEEYYEEVAHILKLTKKVPK